MKRVHLKSGWAGGGYSACGKSRLEVEIAEKPGDVTCKTCLGTWEYTKATPISSAFARKLPADVAEEMGVKKMKWESRR